MTRTIFSNIAELGLLSLVLVTLSVPAMFLSSEGVRPFDTAYLLSLSDD